jgi:hypothetical protein
MLNCDFNIIYATVTSHIVHCKGWNHKVHLTHFLDEQKSSVAFVVLEKSHSLEVNPFAIDWSLVMRYLACTAFRWEVYICALIVSCYCCLFTFLPPQTFIWVLGHYALRCLRFRHRVCWWRFQAQFFIYVHIFLIMQLWTR